MTSLSVWDDYDRWREQDRFWRDVDELEREQREELDAEEARFEPLPNQIPLLPRRGAQ